MFVDWCVKEGVVMPKLEYPAIFENGLIGIRIKEDIANREAYLYVPYKMSITVSKILENPILRPIIDSNPQCFHEYMEIDWQLFVLTLGIIYEITLG